MSSSASGNSSDISTGLYRSKTGLISKIINYLYPSACPSCGNGSDAAECAPVCTQCWMSIKRYSGPSCSICSALFASEHAEICSGCMTKRPFFSKATSFGLYDGVLATSINLFKFHGIKRLSRPLGHLLHMCAPSGSDALVPVPLSIRSLRERGFNQSLLLAKSVSDITRTPLIMDGLIKHRETLPQIGLSGKQRISNIKDAFRVRKNFEGMKVLLIDDVMTTGATVNECSKQLLKAGAQEVQVLTMARAGNL